MFDLLVYSPPAATGKLQNPSLSLKATHFAPVGHFPRRRFFQPATLLTQSFAALARYPTSTHGDHILSISPMTSKFPQRVRRTRSAKSSVWPMAQSQLQDDIFMHALMRVPPSPTWFRQPTSLQRRQSHTPRIDRLASISLAMLRAPCR